MKTQRIALAIIAFVVSIGFSSCTVIPRGGYAGGPPAGFNGPAPQGAGHYSHSSGSFNGRRQQLPPQNGGGQGFGKMTPGAEVDGPMDRTSLDNPSKYFSGKGFERDPDGLLTKQVCLGICKGTSIGWDNDRRGFTSELPGAELLNVDLVVASMAKHMIVPNPPPAGSKRPDLGALVFSKVRMSGGQQPAPQPYL